MKIKLILLGLPFIAACSDTVEPVAVPDTVGTAAAIVSEYSDFTKSGVRANAYKENVPSESAPLAADIWFSTTKDIYLGNSYGTAGVSSDGLSIDAHRKINYIGPSITNSELETGQRAIKYPIGKTLYCVGLYPQGAWHVTTDGKTARASVDGESDLMYAPQISGTQSVPLSATTQQFSHHLCWVKIRVRSQDLTAGETWGKIKTIEILTRPEATVDLHSGNVTFDGTDTYLTALDSTSADGGGMKMPTMSTEVGSIFVSPIKASPYKYTVRVVCQNHEKVVEVPLTDNEGNPYTGDTAGKVFVITLFFSPLSTIEFTASLSDWEDEARVITLN